MRIAQIRIDANTIASGGIDKRGANSLQKVGGFRWRSVRKRRKIYVVEINDIVVAYSLELIVQYAIECVPHSQTMIQGRTDQ